jgi:TRAP-type C4-dicarboxylate transport system permease small subunit
MMLSRWISLGGWLVWPLCALLCLQWPLRDLVQAGSVLANDLAQLTFALYMAVALTAATRARVHLCAARPATLRPNRWRRWLGAVCVLPWAGFVLWSAAPTVWQSCVQAEHFSETLSPGYWVIRLALALMLLLVMVQAWLDLRARPAAAA